MNLMILSKSYLFKKKKWHSLFHSVSYELMDVLCHKIESKKKIILQ